jgi:hypothetical protein
VQASAWYIYFPCPDFSMNIISKFWVKMVVKFEFSRY